MLLAMKMKGLVVFSTLALARPSSAFVAPRAIVGATGAERTENGVFLAETVVGASYEGPGKINSSIDLDSPKVVNNEVRADALWLHLCHETRANARAYLCMYVLSSESTTNS